MKAPFAFILALLPGALFSQQPAGVRPPALLGALSDLVAPGRGTLRESVDLDGILLPQGARIALLDDALLVNCDGTLGDGVYTTANLETSTALVKYVGRTIPKSLLPVKDQKTLALLFTNPAEEDLVLREDYLNRIPAGFKDDLKRRETLEVIAQLEREKKGFILVHGTLSSAEALLGAGKPIRAAELIDAMLEETLNWFKANPPAADGSNAAERRRRSLLLDQAALEFPGIGPGEWFLPYPHNFHYARAAYERRYPILRYLRKAEARVLEEVRNTEVKRGVRVWKLYNMGIIVKTPDLCFAMDLNSHAADFSGVLDFAVVSHQHSDHIDQNNLFNKMLSAKKPVYSTPGPKGMVDPRMTFIAADTTVKQGSATIFFKVSGQDAYGTIYPCNVTTVDCGPLSGGVTVMHSGDANVSLEHLKGDRDIDFFDFAGQVWWKDTPAKAVEAAGARFTNFDHLLELGHNPDPETFAEAYVHIEALPAGRAFALTWGESILVE